MATRITLPKITPARIEEVAVEAVMNPFSTLSTAGNQMWERSYNKNLVAGEEPKGAAIHAWMHVRKFYRKEPITGKWVRKKSTKKRSTKRPSKKPRVKNPVTLRSVMSRALR